MNPNTMLVDKQYLHENEKQSSFVGSQNSCALERTHFKYNSAVWDLFCCVCCDCRILYGRPGCGCVSDGVLGGVSNVYETASRR